MLTPTTRIHTPGLIDHESWTGTIADHFDLAGDRAWDKLDAILDSHAPVGDDEDDDRNLEDALADLCVAGCADLDLVRALTGDPNATILAGAPRLSESERMPAGELQTIREYLGLTGEAMAGLLHVNPRTIRDWESGREPIPYRIREEVEAIEAETDQAVGEVVQALTSSHDPDAAIVVYRTDRDLHEARPDASHLTARWWRHVAYRAALEVPGTPILNQAEAKAWE